MTLVRSSGRAAASGYSPPPPRAPTQVLCWGELGTFFIIAKRIGDSLGHGLAVCGASNGFGSCEVHSEFGVEKVSFMYSNWSTSVMR